MVEVMVERVVLIVVEVVVERVVLIVVVVEVCSSGYSNVVRDQ